MKLHKKNIITILMLSLFVMFTLFTQSCSIINKSNKDVIAMEDNGEDTEDDINPILRKVNDRNCVILDIQVKGNEKYADMSKIKEGHAFLYVVNDKNIKKNFTVTVNAGHGVKNGSTYKTYSHPDMTPKLTGGTNKEGDVMSMAISEGMIFNNGDTEKDINLKVSEALRDSLLDNGYNVLMIREDNDSKLDNIARTVLANNHSDIHISIHFDSTEKDKGVFVILPYNDERYLSMEPVCDIYEETNILGEDIIEGFYDNKEKVWSDGKMYMDLTQISYSTIPSIDLELGDKETVVDDEKIGSYVKCIIDGIDKYYEYTNFVDVVDYDMINTASDSDINENEDLDENIDEASNSDINLDENVDTIEVKEE